MKRPAMERLGDEFEGADLGDARRSARLVRIVEALERDPRSGFPQALESAAELEAFYRFINNDGFDADAVFAPHREATLRRAAEAPEVIVVHDTTTIEFAGEGTREGLGYTTALGRQGFMAHTSLCLCAKTKVPLGIAHMETYSRTGKTWQARKKGRTRAKHVDGPRESERWLRGVGAVPTFNALHVMDAEADFFGLFDHFQKNGGRFIIRAGQLARIVDADGVFTHLRSAVDRIQARAWREIPLTKRVRDVKTKGSNGRRRHPPRSARTAWVSVGAASIAVPRTRYRGLPLSDCVAMNVVRVWEENPPTNEPAVEWILLTSEPIDGDTDIESVVDRYRLRWTIEDYFKALKTGCSLERRQVESYDALRKVLAMLAPIALRLLYLRGLERSAPRAKPETAFSPLELMLMREAPATRGLPAPKTVSDALALLARLGGHIKHNGPPGWLTLGRGYEKLLLLRLGWTLALNARNKSDPS